MFLVAHMFSIMYSLLRAKHFARNQLLTTQNIMNKLFTLLVTALTIAAVNPTFAADAKPGEKKETAVRALPFRGKIAAVDKQANTIKVGERTFQIAPDTRIMKAGKPATITEANVGEDVGGSFREGADKKLNLVSLRIGAKPESPTKGGTKE